MVTMQSWMFLSSFEKMREKMLAQYTITNLMHMENMVMGIAFGTAVSIFRKNFLRGYKGTYNQIKLQDVENGEPTIFPVMSNRFAQVSSTNFSKIPGSPVAYWVSENFVRAFENKTIGELAKPRQGLATGCNDIFIRQWYEVKIENIKFDAHSIAEAVKSKKKWFPYNKGGEFRKWYGNNDFVVNWENDGLLIRNFKNDNGKLRSRPQNTQFYFRESVSWSLVSSGSAAFRYKPYGYIFDIAGMSCFSDNMLYYLLGFTNTPISMEMLSVLAPTINFQAGDIANLPVAVNKEKQPIVEKLVNENIALSKVDWDSFETSWDFEGHPLV